MKATVIYAVIAIIIIGLVVVVGLNSTSGVHVITTNSTSSQINGSVQQASAVSIPVLLTDPPHAPVGTSAILISYSSVALHLSNAGNTSGWIMGSGSGKLNLSSLVNVSQVIANVSIPVNSLINQVRFNVSAASITINGTTYNLTIPSNHISAHITSDSKINASSGALLDLSPTIATIYTSNSTIFVMVPSIRAIVIGNQSANINSHVGKKITLEKSQMQDLNHTSPNLSISSFSAFTNKSNTKIVIRVKNNGNSSVVINHVLLKGMFNTSIQLPNNTNINIREIVNHSDPIPQIIENQTEGGIISKIGNSISSNITDHVKLNLTGNVPYTSLVNSANTTTNVSLSVGDNRNNKSNDQANGSASMNTITSSNVVVDQNRSESRMNTSEHGNASSNLSERISIDSNELLHVGRKIVQLRELNFLVTSNALLELPFSTEDFSAPGYTLAPNSSVTLVFNGTIAYGNGAITVSLEKNSSYAVRVIGDEGAYASINSTT